MAGTRKPLSANRADTASARALSPSRIGWMGVADSNSGNPSWLAAWRKRAMWLCRRRRRCSSPRAMCRAARDNERGGDERECAGHSVSGPRYAAEPATQVTCHARAVARSPMHGPSKPTEGGLSALSVSPRARLAALPATHRVLRSPSHLALRALDVAPLVAHEGERDAQPERAGIAGVEVDRPLPLGHGRRSSSLWRERRAAARLGVEPRVAPVVDRRRERPGTPGPRSHPR